jgi:hypothetical protein
MTGVGAIQCHGRASPRVTKACVRFGRVQKTDWRVLRKGDQQNRGGYDPRREVAQKRLSLDLLRDPFNLSIESGPLWRGRRKMCRPTSRCRITFPAPAGSTDIGLKTSDVPGNAGLISSGAHVRRTAEKRSTMQCRNIIRVPRPNSRPTVSITLGEEVMRLDHRSGLRGGHR